jgi:hypothetical protein
MRSDLVAPTLAVAASLLAAPAFAGIAVDAFPIGQYAMPNGDGVAAGGTWNYWDATYSGVGNVTQDAAPLAFGTGKLTDGVVATAPWFLVSDSAGLGPHVGWRLGSATNPLVAFSFLMPVCICRIEVEAVTIWMDNAQLGGVGAPLQILVNGVPRPFVPPPIGDFGPVEIGGLDLRRGDPTLQFIQDPAHPWTFVSEIVWSGQIIFVPEPAALSVFAIGLGGVLLARRSRPGSSAR